VLPQKAKKMNSSNLIAVAILALIATFGCSKTAASQPDDAKAVPVTVSASGAQIVSVVVNENGFAPNQVELKRGVKATLQFKRTTDQTCATAVAFPELGITKDLPLNQLVAIEVPTDEAKTLTFQCGMGMYKSKLVVQ